MHFARVIGTVVCTVRVPSFRAHRLLMLEPTDAAGAFKIQAAIPDDPGLIASLTFLQGADASRISEVQELIVLE